MLDNEPQRIKQFRESLDLSQTQFAEELGVKQGFISEVEKGKSFFSYEKLKLLQKKYNLNMLWLMNGTGSPVISNSYNNELSVESINEASVNYILKKTDAEIIAENIKLKEKLLMAEEELNQTKTQLIEMQNKYITLLSKFNPT